jgi:hypothetical protein
VDNSRQTKLRKSSRLAQSRHYKAAEKVGHALQLAEDRAAVGVGTFQGWHFSRFILHSKHGRFN